MKTDIYESEKQAELVLFEELGVQFYLVYSTHFCHIR